MPATDGRMGATQGSHRLSIASSPTRHTLHRQGGSVAEKSKGTIMDNEEFIDTTPLAEESAEPVDASVDTEAEGETQEQKPEQQEQQEPEPQEDEAAKRNARLAHEAREAKKLARQYKAELDALKGERPPVPPDEEM